MRKIAVVYGGSSQHHRTFNEPKYNKFIDRLIYLPDLLTESLEEIDVLLMPSQLHMGLVVQATNKIHAFAENGGVVVSFGPQPQEWIPGQKWGFRPTNFWWWLDKNASSGLVLEKPEHDMFTYLSLEAATWHYHGVFDPPEGAQTLISADGGGAILYVDTTSTTGAWIVTTLDPEYHYGSYFMPATEVFLDGFFPWLAHGKLA